MMRWWLDKGIDGFRMDVISLISKQDDFPDGKVQGLYGDLVPYCAHGPHVHEYLREMNDKVLRHYDIMTVGEATEVTFPHLHMLKLKNHIQFLTVKTSILCFGVIMINHVPSADSVMKGHTGRNQQKC